MGLKFKGDKTSHKKKRSKLSGSSSSKQQQQQQESEQEGGGGEEEGWVLAPSPALLLGPSYITCSTSSLGSSSKRFCVALQPTTGKVYPFQLPSTTTSRSTTDLAHLEPEELEALVVDLEVDVDADFEPQEVHHVWVCTRVPDTNDKITLRSGSGKFLACDELGQVTADREARGPQEEWFIQESQSSTSKGQFVLKSMYGKFLGIDELAGGKFELRCDGEEETDSWRITMQGEYVKKAKKQYNDRNGIKTKEVEGTSGSGEFNGLTIVGDLGAREKKSILRYQARGGRKYVGTEEDKKDLKRAKREGKLSEAMLDRRTKLKSDRYC